MIRRNRGLLARPEAAALAWLLPRVPRGVTPDQLSAGGLAGAALAATGFALVLHHRGWLLLVAAGLAANWLGDSLDGKLARQRGPDRGMAGLLIDNGIDTLSYLLLALGFAASGLVAPGIPFLLLALYLMLANLALARLAAGGVFDLAVGVIGTTELRAGFLVLAALLALAGHEPLLAPVLFGCAALDLAALAWALAMAIAFLAMLRLDLRQALATTGRR